MMEIDLYPAFKTWLSDQHTFGHQYPFWVYDSVRIHPLELDVVSLYKHRKNCFYITSIEVKISDFNGVFQQALVRGTFCNYCYIAFPVSDFIGDILYRTITNYEKLKSHGIGVLIYDDIRDRIWTVINATRSKFVTTNNTRTQLVQKLNALSHGQILKEVAGVERYLKEVKS